MGDGESYWRNGKLPRKVYDFVVYASTTDRGSILCEFIARNVRGKLNWCIAGSERKKLEKQSESLSKLLSLSKEEEDAFPFIHTNNKISDTEFSFHSLAEFEPPTGPATIDELTAQCHLIIDCNRRSKLSEKIIQSCIKTKSHYIHYFPHYQFVHDMTQKYHTTALQENLLFLFVGFWENVCKDAVVMESYEQLRKRIMDPSKIKLESTNCFVSRGDSPGSPDMKLSTLDKLCFYKYDSNGQTKRVYKPRGPSFPSYNDDISHYTTKLCEEVSPQDIGSYKHSEFLTTPSFSQCVWTWICLWVLVIFCKYCFLHRFILWNTSRKSLPEFEYSDSYEILVSCKFEIDPQIEQSGKIVIGSDSVYLHKNTTTPIRMACLIRNPADTFSASCVVSCALCVIQEKKRYRKVGGCSSPIILGPSLLGYLREYGVYIKPFIEREMNDFDDITENDFTFFPNSY